MLPQVPQEYKIFLKKDLGQTAGDCLQQLFMQSPGAEERFVQAVRLASCDLNVKTGGGQDIQFNRQLP
jgi:hypothetical protein